MRPQQAQVVRDWKSRTAWWIITQQMRTWATLCLMGPDCASVSPSISNVFTGIPKTIYRSAFLPKGKFDKSKHIKRDIFKHLQSKRLEGSVCIHVFTYLCLLRWKTWWQFLEKGIKLRRTFEHHALASRPRASRSCHVLKVFISSHGYQLGLR